MATETAEREAAVGGTRVRSFGATERTDRWWLGPGITFVVFSTFVVYTTWALWQAEHYYAAPYLSPFYSPVLFTDTAQRGAAPLDHAWFGAWPSWWPAFLPPSPAIFILVFPLSFRMTCYYYRKAYYRSFAASPPGCAVAPLAGARPYAGETKLLVIQNVHRYALYFALAFVVLLAKDAVEAFSRNGQLGIGLGSVILTVNVFLIAGYTFGCHSLRHLVGGGTDCMSCGKATLRYGTWRKVSWLNARHQEFAWASLLWVMATDLYVRLLSMGVLRDPSTWN